MVSKGPRRAEPWTLKDTVVVHVVNTHQGRTMTTSSYEFECDEADDRSPGPASQVINLF